MVKLSEAYPSRVKEDPWQRSNRMTAEKYVAKSKCYSCRKKVKWGTAWGSLMVAFDFGLVACSKKCARRIGCLT